MKFPFYSIICASVLIASCGSNENKNNEKPKESIANINPDSLSDFPVIPDSVVLGAYNDFAVHYEGSINNKYEISMHLVKIGSTIGGTYTYKNKNIPIQLNGNTSSDGVVELIEITNGKVTGGFDGQIIDNKFTGTWTNSNTHKSIPFSVTQTNIASMQNKSDVLSYAMGEYKLTSISGIVGANTMFDTNLENEEWKSTSSSNIGGQREGITIALTQKDIDLLNNLKIVVDNNMNLHFYSGLIELINSPYKANGMDYRIKQTDRTKLNERLRDFSEDRFKYDNKYILLADDKIDFSKTLTGSFDIVTQDNLMLTYIPFNNTFEMEIFVGECCDANILTFTKKQH